MIKFRSAQIAVILLAVVVSLADAEPEIIIEYNYYDIEGRTAAELREQMNRNGVLWTNGNIYDAYTGWNVSWNYSYRRTDTGCWISSVTTILNVEFRLPRWVNYESGPAALKKKWAAYMQALRQHENGHKDFGVKAAGQIERSIAGLEPAPTCDQLADTANKTGRRIISEYAAREREYDARTNFGETQGAIFP